MKLAWSRCQYFSLHIILILYRNGGSILFSVSKIEWNAYEFVVTGDKSYTKNIYFGQNGIELKKVFVQIGDKRKFNTLFLVQWQESVCIFFVFPTFFHSLIHKWQQIHWNFRETNRKEIESNRFLSIERWLVDRKKEEIRCVFSCTTRKSKYFVHLALKFVCHTQWSCVAFFE